MKRFSLRAWLALALALVLLMSSVGCTSTPSTEVDGTTTTSTTTAAQSGGTTATLGTQDAHDEAPGGQTDTAGSTYITITKADGSVETSYVTTTTTTTTTTGVTTTTTTGKQTSSPVSIPAYSGQPYAILNNNEPSFSKAELTTTSYERYSSLDSLGRCGVCVASVGKDIMPTEDRESISSVTPTGWVQGKYPTTVVPGEYIYNRSHLIGFQLTGENANEQNLITGTQYMNQRGMKPFEDMVADYVKETGNHVAYRATPYFEGNNLLASGVQLEAWSIEDNGDGICFNVYCYNVQPDVDINYATGSNKLAASASVTTTTRDLSNVTVYVLNTKTKKFHLPDCSSAKKISAANYGESTLSYDELVAEGYAACKICID